MIKILSLIRKIYWFVSRPRTIGVKAIIKKDNKVLLVKNSYENFLMFPGGTVKRNEAPEEAIRRELDEELGLKTEKPKLIGEFISNKEYKKDTIYLFEINSFQIIKKRSPEIESWDFYDLNNLPTNTSPATVRRIKEHQGCFIKREW